MDRRKYMNGSVAALLLGLSGCLGGEDSSENTENDDSSMSSSDSIGSLYFEGPQSEEESDHVEFSFSNVGDGTDVYYTWEFLIQPESLSDLDWDDYYTLLEFDHGEGTGRAYIRIYGDGSVEWDDTLNAHDETITDEDIINNNEVQRLTIQWGDRDEHRRRVYIDGEIVFDDQESPPIFDMQDGTYYLASDRDGEYGFRGGIQDVRLWGASEYKSEEWISDHTNKQLHPRYDDISNLEIYLQFEDDSNEEEVENIGEGENFESKIIGAEYREKFAEVERSNEAEET